MKDPKNSVKSYAPFAVAPQLFKTPAEWFEVLYEDLANAKIMIYIEIYRLNNDEVGRKVVDLLSEKCKEGVEVKLLVDSWGTKQEESFFGTITRPHGEVRFFDKLKLSFNYFSKNHKRNHRKIVVIDNKILHFGSANLTHYSRSWRESILRVEGSLALTFKRVLLGNWRNASLEFYKKRKYLRNIRLAGGYEIIRDIPSIYNQKVKRHFEKEIRRAKKSVTIVTPYFLPSYKLRRLMILAVRRGVDVSVYIPAHSDVKLVDFLRDKYLGFLHERNIKFFLFQPDNLHAKLLLIDKHLFSIGSTNFDYRSFRYMHEIMLAGTNPEIVTLVDRYIEELQKESVPFDHDRWEKRPRLHKVIGWMLTPLRHLL